VKSAVEYFEDCEHADDGICLGCLKTAMRESMTAAMAEARAEGRREAFAEAGAAAWDRHPPCRAVYCSDAGHVVARRVEQAAKGAAPAAPEAQDPDKFLRDMERAREQLAAEGIAVRPEDWDDAQAKGERDGE
jgi:hypothetical protein